MALLHATIGLSQIASNLKEEAIASFKRAIQLNPSHAPSYAQLGRMLTSIGQPKEGLESILYALRLSPRDPMLPYWLGFAGYAELELGNANKALRHFERALTLNPDQPRNQISVLVAYNLLGKTAEAQARLARLQARLPHLTRERILREFGGLPNSEFRRGIALALSAKASQLP